MNKIIQQALTDESMSGAYICSSPNPVSQRDFARALRQVMQIPIGLPAFEWMVRIGAPLILKTDPELALYGRYVIPERLQQAGFEFQFPEIHQALTNLLAKKS